MTTMEILIIALVINTISNIYVAYITSKMNMLSPSTDADMSDIYQKQLKNYQNIIKLNEKLAKDLLSKSNEEKTETDVEVTRRY